MIKSIVFGTGNEKSIQNGLQYWFPFLHSIKNHEHIYKSNTWKTPTNIIVNRISILSIKQNVINVICIYLWKCFLRVPKYVPTYQRCALTSNSIFSNHQFQGLSNKNTYFLSVRSINGSRYRGGCNVSGGGRGALSPPSAALLSTAILHITGVLRRPTVDCIIHYTLPYLNYHWKIAERVAPVHCFALHRCDMLPLGLGLPLAIISFVGFLLNAYIVLVVVLSKQVKLYFKIKI